VRHEYSHSRTSVWAKKNTEISEVFGTCFSQHGMFRGLLLAISVFCAASQTISYESVAYCTGTFLCTDGVCTYEGDKSCSTVEEFTEPICGAGIESSSLSVFTTQTLSARRTATSFVVLQPALVILTALC
jgi:hypothetical protein